MPSPLPRRPSRARPGDHADGSGAQAFEGQNHRLPESPAAIVDNDAEICSGGLFGR
jgi:hypothetical protein